MIEEIAYILKCLWKYGGIPPKGNSLERHIFSLERTIRNGACSLERMKGKGHYDRARECEQTEIQDRRVEHLRILKDKIKKRNQLEEEND